MENDNKNYDNQRHRQEITPVYIRLPRNRMLCPYSGLTRSYMNSLVLPTKANGFAPPVASRVIKKQYANRGIRLINYESLLSYLSSLEQVEGISGKAK